MTIKTFKLIFIILVLMMFFGCFPKQYNGLPVYNYKFKLSDNNILVFPVTNEGPIPAENSSFKVLKSHIVIANRDNSVNTPELIWFFAIKSKLKKNVSKINIEQVNPKQKIRQVLLANHPVFMGDNWYGRSEDTDNFYLVNDWLFKKQDEVFIFKITIFMTNQEKTILYQPVFISKQLKEKYKDFVKRIERKK